MDSGLESLPADSPLPLLTSSIVTAPLLKLPPRVLPSLGKLCRLVDQVVTYFSLYLPVDGDFHHWFPSEAASFCAGVPSLNTSNTSDRFGLQF